MCFFGCFGHYLKLSTLSELTEGAFPARGGKLHTRTTKYVCASWIPIMFCFFSSADDDYSDTYNATYAVINNGERPASCVTHKFLFHTVSRLHAAHLSPPSPAFLCLFTHPALSRPQQTTTACHPPPPWPTRLPGRIRIGRCPRAPQTTEGIWGLGSLPHPLCPHLLHPCLPSCS